MNIQELHATENFLQQELGLRWDIKPTVCDATLGLKIEAYNGRVVRSVNVPCSQDALINFCQKLKGDDL